MEINLRFAGVFLDNVLNYAVKNIAARQAQRILRTDADAITFALQTLLMLGPRAIMTPKSVSKKSTKATA